MIFIVAVVVDLASAAPISKSDPAVVGLLRLKSGVFNSDQGAQFTSEESSFMLPPSASIPMSSISRETRLRFTR